MSVLSADPETTRRPSAETATPQTYDEDTSSQKYNGRRATHAIRVPFQRRHAFPLAIIDVPHLERVVGRAGHDAPPVRRDGNVKDLRRRHIITKVLQTADAAQRTLFACPSSIATHSHSPLLTSHTLSVLSADAETTRRPSGEMATPQTYDEARSSQKYSGRRNAPNSSALPALPRTRRSPRPRP